MLHQLFVAGRRRLLPNKGRKGSQRPHRGRKLNHRKQDKCATLHCWGKKARTQKFWARKPRNAIPGDCSCCTKVQCPLLSEQIGYMVLFVLGPFDSSEDALAALHPPRIIAGVWLPSTCDPFGELCTWRWILSASNVMCVLICLWQVLNIRQQRPQYLTLKSGGCYVVSRQFVLPIICTGSLLLLVPLCVHL